MRTAVVGGGAAGFFLAIHLKELCPEMEVTIFEKSRKVLAKVEVSGGGRCNCTNSFASVRDLSQVYPRGHRLMKRLFKRFDHRDAYTWFERHGVRLVRKTGPTSISQERFSTSTASPEALTSRPPGPRPTPSHKPSIVLFYQNMILLWISAKNDRIF